VSVTQCGKARQCGKAQCGKAQRYNTAELLIIYVFMFPAENVTALFYSVLYYYFLAAGYTGDAELVELFT